jgi:hypothetical protein
MEFIIRRAKAEDAESIGNLAAEFIEYLRSLGDEAEQKFDAAVFYLEAVKPILDVNYTSKNSTPFK